MRRRSPRLVELRFRDMEVHQPRWRSRKDAGHGFGIRYRAVGYIVRRSRHWLSLAAVTSTDGEVMATYRIPRGAIARIRRLR